ncbi:hypothetical protein EZ428_01665 [Pedobacter frigiditerrae]|uniref:Histidine kinase domain-containing protein n=1 Tax=Pedobacter frigiditerrae TaxID=2530452 RepID=A0A4R0N2H9_9SPHI|nr:sensor histidine kinase [Pedobacter frigiditerrae]TCC93503.1 hypothetical protein EZ428_01665 [Pedobacter frigiditerrae]
MFKFRIAIFAYLFCFVNFNSVAQTVAIKSKINAQINLAKDIVFSDMKRSNRVADSVLVSLRKYKLELEEASIYNLKGIIYNFSGKLDSSLIFFEKAEQIGLKIGDKLTIAKAKQNKNMPYGKMGKYALAMQTIFEAIKYYESINSKSAIARCYGDIGNILIRQDNSKGAVDYLKKAIAMADEVNELSLKTNFYNSLAVAYDELKDKKAAKETYLKGLALAEKLNNVKSQITITLNLGMISWSLDNTDDQSFEYYKKAEKLAISFGDRTNLAYIYQNMGRNYFHQKKYYEALKYTQNAKDLALETKDLYSLVRIYSSLAEIYKNISKYDDSYNSLVLKDSLSKILFNKESSEQINTIRIKYEAEKKEQQILLLDKQNLIQGLELNKTKLELENQDLENEKNLFKIGSQTLLLQKNKILLDRKQLEATAKAQQIKLLASKNDVQKLELLKRNIFLGIIAGALLITILLSYLFYNRYKLKQDARLHEEVITQQDLATKAVLNAEENERKRISGELHDGLGQMFSAVKMNLSALTDGLSFKDEHAKKMFSKTMNLVDESCKEVRVISHQMAPNVLLKSGLTAAVRDFINKIDSRKLKINLETFGLQERLDQNIETVLYRVIQETVNNVIKHSGANSLDIQLNKDEDGINAMIEDNGKGFETNQIEKFEGIGLKNIRTRISFLKGTVDFSSRPGQGTLIAIFIPF